MPLDYLESLKNTDKWKRTEINEGEEKPKAWYEATLDDYWRGVIYEYHNKFEWLIANTENRISFNGKVSTLLEAIHQVIYFYKDMMQL